MVHIVAGGNSCCSGNSAKHNSVLPNHVISNFRYDNSDSTLSINATRFTRNSVEGIHLHRAGRAGRPGLGKGKGTYQTLG